MCDCSTDRLLAMREEEIKQRLLVVDQRDQECHERAQRVEER